MVRNFTLSQADPVFYLTDSAALGASVGRYANRIANAAYTDSAGTEWQLNASQPPHCLHGGEQGFCPADSGLCWNIVPTRCGWS